MKNVYGKTIFGCFIGYVVQAIVNIFVPLLFITFQSEYGIPLDKITLLITVNFFIQLSTDIAASVLVDKLGYRTCVVAAHALAAAGLISLTFLPDLTADPFIGLILSVFLYAIGGGLIEVVISPIVESCPLERKDKTMSLLHSFFCWGSVGVIVISAAFFFIFGIENWRILSLIWAVVPLLNGILFLFAPLKNIIEDGETGLSVPQLLRSGKFWLFFLIILCAGASEAAVSQWASAFVEKSLGLNKTLGDLVGPALFAVAMGLSRLLYGKSKNGIKLNVAMAACGALCVVAYLITSLATNAIISLVGMALCGFSVGIAWPGTYSAASASIKNGGNAMFALLALGGDIGCLSGPTLVGFITDAIGGDMKTGILFAVIFPAVLTVAALSLLRKNEKPDDKLKSSRL